MKTKLEIAKERRTRREQDRADIIALTNEIKAFNKLINDKEDIDLTELKTQLTELPKLIAEPLNTSLGGFLDSFEPYLKMSQQKQKQPDLPGLLKNLKIEQPELDLKPIAKEIAKLKQKAVKQSQRPEDFIPYRRVVKMGNRFLFDDNMTSGGGGGGVDTSGLATSANQQTDALTDTELRATPVPVSGTVTTTSSPAKPTDAYSIQAISDDGTYKYFFFEADDADYYILRKHIANKVFDYTAGTGGYSSVYQSAILGPSGSPVWADYGSTF